MLLVTEGTASNFPIIGLPPSIVFEDWKEYMCFECGGAKMMLTTLPDEDNNTKTTWLNFPAGLGDQDDEVTE
jgi:hypothetical protein